MSRQFDVFANPSRMGRSERPYVLCVQHGSLDYLRTRLVAPLIVEKALDARPRLMPALIAMDRTLYLSPAELFTVSIRYLRDPVANLETERDRIVAALDLVFTGI